MHRKSSNTNVRTRLGNNSEPRLDHNLIASAFLAMRPAACCGRAQAESAVGDSARTLLALEHVRRMRGGTQSQLIRCSDGGYYVVKFQNNPQGVKILCNEMLAGQLARKLGLPVPPLAVVDVRHQLIQHTYELAIQMESGRLPNHPGLCFGSRHVGDGGNSTGPPLLAACEFLSEGQLRTVENVPDFAGMLVFDKWTCNTDNRQAVFVRTKQSIQYRVFMIDNGLCFDGAGWTFPDTNSRGLYCRSVVYDTIRNFDSFEPWLDRLERGIDEVALEKAALQVPVEWYNCEKEAMSRLLVVLDRRRLMVRDMLWSVSKISNHPFRNWNHEGDKARAASNSAHA